MKAVLRWLGLLVIAFVALQLFFVLRIALMAAVDPQSTAFMRSEAWRLAMAQQGVPRWRQQWVPYEQISDHLKRAVIPYLGCGMPDFVRHDGRCIRKAITLGGVCHGIEMWVNPDGSVFPVVPGRAIGPIGRDQVVMR